MKAVKGIQFQVIPLDNDGFLVVADVDKVEEQAEPSGMMPSFSQIAAAMGRQQQNDTQLRYYCADSQRVGMCVQEVIEQAIVSTARRG